MLHRLLLIVGIYSVSAVGSPAAVDECASLTEPSECLLEGKLFAKAVDATRFLIAVDLFGASGEGDGKIDHLFLFSRNAPPQPLPSGIFEGSLWMDTGAGIAEISAKDHEAIPIYFKDRPISHYWGIGTEGRAIESLKNLRPASECDHYEGSCWHANGWRIGFPL